MLQLLQPSWLFALAGISIPVIIHLWNQRPGRILKVGSISLVPEEAKEYKKSLQLSDLLLLLLRCLLIAALAIVLANPNWKKPFAASKQKGWILIGKENLQETYTHFKPKVDSLYKAGFEFHYFNEGFAKEKMEEALLKPADSTEGLLSYWKLAESIDATMPAAIPIYIFSDNYLKHFSGNRPTLSFQPNWFTYTPPSTTIQKTTESKDTTALIISIFTDKYNNDVRYIKAAIDAIQSFSKRDIVTTIINNDKSNSAKQDWLFWLADLPLNESINAKNILSYSTGKQKNISSLINISGNTSQPILLYKSIANNDSLKTDGENIWMDGFGNPLLTRTIKSNKNYYSLFTHFDPACNELVWNDNFPAIVYNLLLRQNISSVAGFDNRLIDLKQLVPAYKPLTEIKNSTAAFETVDISGLFWLLVLLLFFAERFVSFYNTKLKTNG